MSRTAGSTQGSNVLGGQAGTPVAAERSTRIGFTIVELLVVVTLVSVLLAILLPLLNMAREHVNEMKCAANLREIGQGFYVYAANNDHLTIPFKNNTTWMDPAHPNQFVNPNDPNAYWGVLIALAAGLPKNLFTCPSNFEKNDSGGYSNQYTAYGHNGWGDAYSGMSDADRIRFCASVTDTALLKKANGDWNTAIGHNINYIKYPNRTILAQDAWEAFLDGGNNGDTFASSADWNRGALTEYPGHDEEYLRHLHTSNVLFVDCHVERMTKDQQTDERYYTGCWLLPRSY